VVCTPTDANIEPKRKEKKKQIREDPLLPEETTNAREDMVTPIDIERGKIHK
jgi:hypothetical protein